MVRGLIPFYSPQIKVDSGNLQEIFGSYPGLLKNPYLEQQLHLLSLSGQLSLEKP